MDSTDLESKVAQELYELEKVVNVPFWVRKITTMGDDLIVLTQRKIIIYQEETRRFGVEYQPKKELTPRGNWTDIQVLDNLLFVNGWVKHPTKSNILIYRNNGHQYKLGQRLVINGELLKAQPIDDLLFTLVRDNEGKNKIIIYERDKDGKYRSILSPLLPKNIKDFISNGEPKDFSVTEDKLFIIQEDNEKPGYNVISTFNFNSGESIKQDKMGEGKIHKIFAFKYVNPLKLSVPLAFSYDKKRIRIQDFTILKDLPEESLFIVKEENTDKGRKLYLEFYIKFYEKSSVKKPVDIFDDKRGITIRIFYSDKYNYRENHKYTSPRSIIEIKGNLRDLLVSKVNKDLVITDSLGRANIYPAYEDGEDELLRFLPFYSQEHHQEIGHKELMKYFDGVESVLVTTAHFSEDGRLFIAGAKILPQTKESKLRKALNEMFELDGGLKKVKAEGFVVVYRRKENGREE